jgi:hypothetical protein
VAGRAPSPPSPCPRGHGFLSCPRYHLYLAQKKKAHRPFLPPLVRHPSLLPCARVKKKREQTRQEGERKRAVGSKRERERMITNNGFDQLTYGLYVGNRI